MKRILVAAMVLTILLGLAVASASADWWFAMADLTSVDPTAGGYCWGFNALVYPGNWGGMQDGDAAVTAFPGDADPAGYCSFNAKGNVSKIELRVLDGIADDSFEVFVMNPHGKWQSVFTYTADPSTTEYWVTHSFAVFPYAHGTIIKIVPTGPEWTGFGTYGQLAVDYIALYR